MNRSWAPSNIHFAALFIFLVASATEPFNKGVICHWTKQMPEMDGIEATRCIKAKLPKIRVIGLTMHQDEHLIEAMNKAGAEVTFKQDRHRGI